MAQRAISVMEAADTDFARFKTSFLEFAQEADQSDLSSSALDTLAREFWAFARDRKPGETKLRVHNKTVDQAAPFGVLEFITDDKPFVVASVLAELNHFDIAISWVGHPIIAVVRDADGVRKRLVATREELRGLTDTMPEVIRESMMQVAFERSLEPSDAAFLEERIRKVLADVGAVVQDWRPMLAKLDLTIGELNSAAKLHKGDEAAETLEAVAFLEWLRNDHFVFMGVRDYDSVERNGEVDLDANDASGIGLLRDPSNRILRRETQNESLSPGVTSFLSGIDPLTINKANFRSTIQRRVYMDYIGVKRFDGSGRPIGERRFLGLFTSAAYNRLPQEIPILRRKFRLVLERADFAASSYNYNTLVNILETYPRDELFQSSVDELFEISTGIMRLSERPRTRLFLRWDRFDRFVSAMVFVPRERYTAELRERIGEILKEAFNGRVSAFYPQLGDGALVRVHFIIGRNTGPRPAISAAQIEARIADSTRSWRDMLHEALVKTRGEDAAHQTLTTFRDAFSVSYREQFDSMEALSDIARIEALRAFPDVGIKVYRNAGDPETALRIKLYRRIEPITLSKSLPIFEHLGLSVVEEFSYQVLPGLSVDQRETVHLHDFLLTHPKNEKIDIAKLTQPIESAFPAIWLGEAEDDGFNRLIIEAGIPWHEVAAMRAFARYLVQTGSSLSQPYMEETLAANAGITRKLIELFRATSDPDNVAAPEVRVAEAGRISAQVLNALESVQSLDQDRILRRFLNLIEATLRTNYFQTAEDGGARPTIAFKLSSKLVEGLPEPRPNVEIFVYSPRFEGVHLRFGPVARGGIRWSDRREDFRTEVLGLVKAQYVKNAVIVPVGAKGGFVPKRLAAEMTREQIQAEGVACYKLFVATLLELTDNLDIRRPEAPPLRPARTVCHDGPDPYLVVAADKGTATFSDIANSIALEKQFWLGDAFASGGSNGYDHKVMGITAKGAWEAVKRHFREIDTDIQATSFTVIGVGDMSGDVFGNAMLLSRKIKLVAAFDHRDIFFDPTPDHEESFRERERLFALPRSSWQDYDKKRISKGGGVFSRKAKSIPLSKEMREILGVTFDAMSPFDLMRALLLAKVDLLWFGGIGTFVKGRAERNADVGDTANDSIRVDGEDIRAKVVGEGANLGCTQRGRIAFALKGGRINTDAIDNSAGVDCSDHEVNIKILLDAAVAQAALKPAERNTLLKQMTDDVAAHVLVDNYDQTLALSLGEITAKDEIDSHARLIRLLEREGRLKREIERLPSEDELQERKTAGMGLTRPELAVLLAYSKIKTFEDVIASAVPDDPALVADLVEYFPQVLDENYASQLRGHRLRREIITTVLSNQMTNIGGVNFASRLRELSGAETPAIARAFTVVRNVFDILDLRAHINALDGTVDASLQLDMHTRLRTFARRQSTWFLRRGEYALSDIAALTQRYKPHMKALRAGLKAASSNYVRGNIESLESELMKKGVPPLTAHAVASLEPLFAAGDIVDLALQNGVPVEAAARAQAMIGEATGLERLFVAAIHLTAQDHWERMALRRIVEDLSQHQAALAGIALKSKTDGGVEFWLKDNAAEVKRYAAAFEELEGGTGLTVARLSLAVGHVRDLVVHARGAHSA